MCDREESRPVETIAQSVLKPVAKIFPTLVTTPTTSLGQAMVNRVVTPSEEKIELYDLKGIMRLAVEYNK